MLSLLLNYQTRRKTKRQQERHEKHIQSLLNVFYYMDESQLPWVLKELQYLKHGDVTRIMEVAHQQIQLTPSFHIQTIWYNRLLGTRIALVQLILIDLMAKTGQWHIENTIQFGGVILSNGRFVVNNYRIDLVWYLDDYGADGKAYVLLTYFNHGLFDRVLTPTYIWRLLINAFDADRLMVWMNVTDNLMLHFPTIYEDTQREMDVDELGFFLQCIRVNAERYHWVELFEETTKVKRVEGNIVYLH